MSDTPKRKFGPTRGEYQFRIVAGCVIIGLLVAMIFAKGMPEGIVVSESILFGGLFGLFLIGHSAWKLWTGDHR